MTKKLGATFILSSVLVCNFCMGFAVFKPADENHYCGADGFSEQSETINYSRKETTEYSIKGDLPNYTSIYGSSNCANIAGSVIIGYYDRLFENLIPDYKTYTQIGSVIKYKFASTQIEQVASDLYSLMGTDKNQAGTTYDGFQAGMKSYAEGKGYSYSIEDLGSLDFAKYQAAVQNNKPVALFLSRYSMLTSSSETGSSETVKSSYSTYAHVEVGCGYRVVTYYNASNQVLTTRTYLKVASGLKEFNISYLCLDGKSTIDRATSITIS